MIDVESKNLRLMRQSDPQLFQWINEFTSPQVFREILTPSGYPTLLYTGGEHDPYFLHDPENPFQEAERMIQNYEFKGEDITILMGFGLGYLPLSIQKRMHPDHRLLVVEASPDILVQACRLVDLEAVWRENRIQICPADQFSRIWQILDQYTLKVLGGRVSKLIHPPSFNLLPEAYRTAESEIEQIVAVLKENFNSLEALWETTLENALFNLPAVRSATAVDRLFGVADGKPALVVAAGPSLDKNIDQIGPVQDRFVIIAVDGALRPLEKRGIHPDFVVAVDPNLANLAKFEGTDAEAIKNISLVFSPMVYHEIPKRMQGPHFIFGEPNRICDWVLGLCDPVARFPYGFSVAHFAMYLARAMAADPIIFAGLDLAFSPQGDHARDSAIQWHYDYKRRGYIEIPGIDGKPVPTCEGFAKMVTLFEREIAQTDARCIDATEGGALIRGSEVIPLAQVIARWGSHPLSALKGRLKKLARPKPFVRADGWQTALHRLVVNAENIDEICREAIHLLAPLVTDGDDGSVSTPSPAILQQINGLADRIAQQGDFLYTVKDCMAAVMVDQYRKDFEVARTPDPLARLRLELVKSELFFNRLSRISAKIIDYTRHVN